MPSIKGPLDLQYEGSAQFLQALGRLVAESALLESQIDWGIWWLVGKDQRTGQIVSAELDFRRKVDLLRSLVRHHIKEARESGPILELLAKCHELYNERNDYLHGQWAPSKTNLERGVIRQRAKGEYKFVLKDVNVTAIEGLADRFNSAAAQLIAAQAAVMFS